MYILDHVKYMLNQEIELLKQETRDDYDEGRLNTMRDTLDLIRVQEACFDEEKFLNKNGFKEPELAPDRFMKGSVA